MSDPRTVLDRLVAERGESYANLSRVIGRNPAYLQQYVRRGSPRVLDEGDRRVLARYLGVTEQALGAADAPVLVHVPRLPVGASAGQGRFVGEEAAEGMLGFDPALLRRLGVRQGAASLIRVEGDSMRPTLNDGDTILVDRDDRTPGKIARLYVLRLGDAVMVKRVARDGAVLDITSDNPDHPSPGRRDPAEVEIVGRVAWLSRALG